MRAKRENARPLRSGYTTGACAAAAAKAATAALVTQSATGQVEIGLPGGGRAAFQVEKLLFNAREASCCVIKDAGDDPDITNGAEIRVDVSWTTAPGIDLRGGQGVGRVTRPGLEVAVGSPAINPVPRRMIIESVREAAGNRLDGTGLQVTISVPQGEELARKTLNPRLGIVGGISILGTTGIVVPYSVDAYQACITQAVDVAVASGCPQVVLTTGRRSEKFAQQELALAEECFVQAGDFIGFSLAECARKQVPRVTVWGMPGKISKMAAGHLATNVRDSQVDIGFLRAAAADCGVPDEALKDMPEVLTANHFRQLIPAECRRRFADRLCLLAATQCRRSVADRLEVECVMADYEGNILGRASVKS